MSSFQGPPPGEEDGYCQNCGEQNNHDGEVCTQPRRDWRAPAPVRTGHHYTIGGKLYVNGVEVSVEEYRSTLPMIRGASPRADRKAKTEQQVEEQKPPVDMPGGLQDDKKYANLSRQLPNRWILAVYGIPQEESYLRRQICYVLKDHGMQSLDSRKMKNPGGSAYIGPENPRMDAEIRKLVDDLAARTGASDLLNIFVGTYDGLTAQKFVDTVTKNALLDLGSAEKSLIELEKALTGEIVLLNRDNKELNLESTGYGRLETANRALADADSVLARFNGDATMLSEGERIRVRIAQISAWTDKVQMGYDRWLAHKRGKAGGSE